ncbi:hypothetical protein NEUTE1DRAFT_101758 [Neurospora tetrasperma FGSC 2508]|uniref:Uncharacterized protein n=1 Tax=Neurospora tetrasperma (strain FGSC 2508 / ATCC MYA-4615 / P0657) TaxID=510951 RepID=F8MQ49_NEUT8|nr:uncharacterized protein NEUTE1DRAFT_101758 [Neurospora tetrasperma FGSC 2508]EGO56479.1 hypothetical protein NEUTE1DRAFT_101758 [Neurospora tetrasperma FGSC 2508]
MSDLSGQRWKPTFFGMHAKSPGTVSYCTRYLVVLVGAGALASALSAHQCSHLPVHPSILNAPTESTFQTGTPSSGTERGDCASTRYRVPAC